MFKRVLLVALLVTGCLAGLAITRTTAVTQADSPALTPCDFVERFKIVNRSTQITSADIPFIKKLIWRGVGDDEAINELGSWIDAHGPITKIEQLTGLEKFDGSRYSQAGENRSFLVRLFYALEGDEICMVSSVQTGSSSLGQGGEQLSPEGVFQRVIVLESEIEDLKDTIDDLEWEMDDLEDELEELQDLVEELESQIESLDV